MIRLLAASLSLAVALVVPPLLVVTGVRVLAHGWYVRFLYERGGVPADRYGLSGPERARLALVGLEAILPAEEQGLERLRRARLPDGSPAFGGREIAHMADVRSLVASAYRLQVGGGLALLALALATLPVRRLRRALLRGLRLGAWLSVGLAALVGALSLLSWGSFSTPFHSLFFEGDSWRFADTDTLRRLYPDRFWVDTAIALGALTVLQALALLLVLRLLRLVPGGRALRPARQA